MAILTFEVKGQTLTVKSSIGKIVENSRNYLSYDIIPLDSDWMDINLSKTLLVAAADGKVYEYGYNIIPDEVIKAPGFQVSLIGKKENTNLESDVNNGKLITTSPIFVQVFPSGKTEADGNGGTSLPELSSADTQLIAFQDAVDTIKKISNNKVNDFSSPNDKNYPTTKAVSDFVEEKNSPIIEKTKSNTSELKALKKNQTYESTSFSSLPLYDHKIKYGGTEWTNSIYKHSLIKISSDLWGKTIILHTREDSYSEIAFFEDFNIEEYDYTSAPPYVAGTDFIQMGTGENREFDYLIPENTSWIYFSRQTDTGADLTPEKLEIEGYDYCKGVADNIINLISNFSIIEEDYASALKLIGGAE